MKNKKIKMIISFLLAIVLLVSLPLDIQANAVALEGWAIYALISYLAAMGITFTVSGGVDALLKAVQEKTDEYIKVTGIDLLGIIHQSVTIRGGGNGGGWWFGFAAAAAVMEFIQWVRENGWANGETVSEIYNLYEVDFLLIEGKQTFISSTVGEVLNTSSIDPDTKHYKVGVLGDYIPYSEFPISYFKEYDHRYDYQYCTLTPDLNVKRYYNSKLDYSETAYSDIISEFGYTINNVLGLAFIYQYQNAMYYTYGYLLMGDNTLIGPLNKDAQSVECLIAIGSTANKVQFGSSIQAPEEFPDITFTEDEGVLIDTGADVSTLTSPEELAENIKQIFDDTGTITKPTVIVQKDTTIIPTPPPEVTPEPSPEIEDIEDLGLPALGEAIKNKFPFCLPSDLRDLISLLVAEPVTPKWEVDLYEWFDGNLAGDTTFGIDLAEYEVLGQISRWASVISFSIFLLLITKGMIGW